MLFGNVLAMVRCEKLRKGSEIEGATRLRCSLSLDINKGTPSLRGLLQSLAHAPRVVSAARLGELNKRSPTGQVLNLDPWLPWVLRELKCKAASHRSATGWAVSNC